MIRCLRIAASFACLVACFFVVELRGRSRLWTDGAYGRVTPTRTLVVATNFGRLRCWTIESASLAGFPAYGRFQKSIFGCVNPFDTAIFANSSPPAFSVPLSVVASLAAAFAVVPWTAMRFSVRTMLAGMTVVAVVLGMAVGRM
jgi:hypothetical protein